MHTWHHTHAQQAARSGAISPIPLSRQSHGGYQCVELSQLGCQSWPPARGHETRGACIQPLRGAARGRGGRAAGGAPEAAAALVRCVPARCAAHAARRPLAPPRGGGAALDFRVHRARERPDAPAAARARRQAHVPRITQHAHNTRCGVVRVHALTRGGTLSPPDTGGRAGLAWRCICALLRPLMMAALARVILPIPSC